jgi:hypothetical protein
MRILPWIGFALALVTSQALADQVPLARYCFIPQEKPHPSTKTCYFDCLINTEVIEIAMSEPCPLTVRQRVFSDGRTMLETDYLKLHHPVKENAAEDSP